jgi:putative Ca2+/H+ antiporter (TMEM165/GDT1 family)
MDPITAGLAAFVLIVPVGLLTLLPKTPVQLAAAALFAVGAVILFRSACGAEADEADAEREYERRITHTRSGWRAALTSFVVLFTAEWGDLSQLLTAGLVASGRPALAAIVTAAVALV